MYSNTWASCAVVGGDRAGVSAIRMAVAPAADHEADVLVGMG